MRAVHYIVVSLLLAVLVIGGIASGQEQVSITGIKFYDHDKTGTVTVGDFPLEGWTIYLKWLNGTNVSGKQALTGPDGTYNISGIDPFYSYTLNEVVPSGWTNVTQSSIPIEFVITCGSPGNRSEFFATTDNMISFMDCDTKVLFGYNTRVGNAVSGGPGSGEEGKIMYTLGNWNSGESSSDLSPEFNLAWQNYTYVPFNATFVPGGIGTATWTVNNTTAVQNTVFPTRPDATPPRDIVIRLHVEKKTTPQIVEVNNLSLKQGVYTYTLQHPYILQVGEGDTWLVLRASNLLIEEGGTDIATGGFELTGDIRLTWSTANLPSSNDLKMDILVGQYDCVPVISITRNFFNFKGGQISGYKNDTGGNYLDNWNITLYNASEGLQTNVTTNGGYYSFNDIPFGFIYELNETPKTGFTQITPNTTVNLSISNQSFEYNFTNMEQQVGFISGYKLYPNETGILNWTIELYNETDGGTLFDSQLTDGNGFYNFTGLPYGVTFNVSEVVPAGWTPVGSTYHNGLNIDGNLSYENQNFTNVATTYCIEGYKLDNCSELGLPGWTITAKEVTGAEIGNTTTNETGWYQICNLLPGDYTISEEVEAGWLNVTPLCQNITIIDNDIPDINFTNTRLLCIEGYKINNQTGQGIPGWNITVNNQTGEVVTVMTNSTGGYQVCGLAPGEYQVCEQLIQGWVNVSPLCQNVTVSCDNITNLNFTNEATTYCVEGFKLDNCTKMGLPGWTITAKNVAGAEAGNISTNVTGWYQICNLLPGDYIVCEQMQAGWLNVTPLCQNITIVDKDLTDVNFTNTKLLCIEGYKINDQTGQGIAGWNITVSNQTGEVATAVTNASGWYQVCGLSPDEYQVCEELAQGWLNVSPLCQNVTISCDNISDLNFTNVAQTGSISGYKIWFETGSGLDGWTIDLYNQTDGNTFVASTVTSGGGFYNFTGLPLGTTYNVSEVVQPGWTPVGPTFVPGLALNGTNPSYENVNFTNDPTAPGTGTIKGNKFEEDCVQTGCGLPGWTITLHYAGNGSVYNSTLTGPCGSFEFLDVPFGTYLLNETLQPGWIQETPNTTVTLDSNHTLITFDFINRKNTTCCACPPTTTFTYEKNGKTVNFADTSTGPLETRWIWFFGDGTISTEQNPTKVYTKPGAYTVRMYVLWQNCPFDTPGYWKSYSERIIVP
jgi:PKD repeat protein